MIGLIALLALLLCVPVSIAADPPARRGHPTVESDEPEDDRGLDDEEGLDPRLPDDEPLGHGDELERRPPSRPRSSPTLPDEDDEENAPPADVEPARTGPAQPASPAQPLAPSEQ